MSVGRPLIKVSDWGPDDRRRQILEFWKEMAPIVVSAVEASFVKAKMLHPTRAEAVRRTEMARSLVQDMANLRWSTARIKDVLPRVLAAKLLGIEFSLEAMGVRSTW